MASYASVAIMEEAESIIQTALDSYGKLDILVNPAGILRDRMVFNMTEEEWDQVIQVHLKGHFCLIKPASILFRQQRSGRIITFSSTSGLFGNSGQVNYGAAKDGVAGLTRVVARDLGRYGVTCNSISPGAETRMTASVPATAREVRAERGLGGQAAPGPLELERPPEAIAPVAVWLASDETAKHQRPDLPRERRHGRGDEPPRAGANVAESARTALDGGGVGGGVSEDAGDGPGQPGAAGAGPRPIAALTAVEPRSWLSPPHSATLSWTRGSCNPALLVHGHGHRQSQSPEDRLRSPRGWKRSPIQGPKLRLNGQSLPDTRSGPLHTAHFETADLETLPLPDGAMDLAVCALALTYCSD